ncbi:lysine--tRNA ligase [Candidatus Aerophobetes bacterium]|uniref:Lysine--tRNA ligase n=2 Tax=Aerophobetes bacterium TaxID=2030807 RepID=A0A662DFR8_UNCAE|nr:MAG: lysine--tRNA ligase [Candidatus Aerophobetes bacterium]
MPLPEDELVKERKEKLAQWIKLVGNPYWERFSPQDKIKKIREKFGQIKKGEKTAVNVSIAGRVIAQRAHGKATFFDLKDGTDKIQLYGRFDRLNDKYELLSKIDIGDIIGVKGEVFKTHTGELTVEIEDFTLLAKSLHPLPEKWHGLQDVEIRYRKRWLDLLVNPRVKEIFLARGKIVKTIREFLDKRDFIEVETPIMQYVPGGATARPFKTYHNALGRDFYLRIAPELYLKKLVVGGLEKIYEMNKNFRNEGIDRFHNPEFTMLELYQAYANYFDIMQLTQDIICEVAYKLKGSLKVQYADTEIDFSPPWRKITFKDALREIGKIEVDWTNEESLREVARSKGLNVEGLSKSQILDHLLDKSVVPHLIQPTIIYDYPFETAPLAKRKKEDPLLVERFELFVSGWEIANAYSELNDPLEQRERLKRSADERFIDEDFLEALEYGMPPTGGLGIGIDRLVMLFTNSASIREVILFPQLRPKKIT